MDRELLWEVREPLPRAWFARPARTSRFDTWLQQALGAFRALAASPVRLFAVMFALNAVSNPYSGLVHDAVVYSLQALNAASGGAYASDLFLKYGSQDRYSLFSPLVAPIVRLLDVRPAFFVLFLASTAFWLWAASRLLRELFDDAAVAAAAAIFVAVAPMWYGGIDIFHVAEPFFTPRLPACALAMLGIAWVLRGRIWPALASLLAAALLHPILALPALVVWGGYVLLNRLTRLQAALACIAVAVPTTLVLANVSIGGHAFPQMDDTWRNIVHWSPLNFPLDWAPADWLGVAGGVSIVSAGAWVLRARDRAAAQVLALVALAGAGGVVIAVFASQSSNALLFQAQAYRALWLVSFFEGPVAVLLLLHLYRAHSRLAWVAGIVLIAYIGRRQPFGVQLALTIALFLVAFTVHCIRTSRTIGDIAWRSAAWAVFLVALALPVLPPIAVAIVHPALLTEGEPLLVVAGTLATLAPLGWFLIATFALVMLRGRSTWIRPAMLVACALTIHAVAFAAPLSRSYRERFDKDARDIAFAQDYIQHARSAGPLSVYADFALTDDIWVDWRATSYLEANQAVGTIFSRDNALEVQRRAALVRPFEAPRWRRLANLVPFGTKVVVDRMYGLADAAPAPTAADLQRLCADRELDLAIVSGPPLTIFKATNGHVSVYDCRLLRTAMVDRTPVVTKVSDVE